MQVHIFIIVCVMTDISVQLKCRDEEAVSSWLIDWHGCSGKVSVTTHLESLEIGAIAKLLGKSEGKVKKVSQKLWELGFRVFSVVENFTVFVISVNHMFILENDYLSGIHGGSHHFSHAAWSCCTLLELAGSRRQPAWASPTSFIVVTTTASSAIPSAYCRISLISCSSIRLLELLDIGHSVIPSLPVFGQRLKTFLFCKSFPYFIMTFLFSLYTLSRTL